MITNEMIEYFEVRTKAHINLVDSYMEKMIKEIESEKMDRAFSLALITHDLSKFTIPERDPYIYLGWKCKLEKEGESYTFSNEIENEIQIAVYHHFQKNPHHPEYWDDSFSIKKKANAQKMPNEYIMLMVSDWLAMSEDLEMDPIQWADDNIGEKWSFSKPQKNYIYFLIKKYRNKI